MAKCKGCGREFSSATERELMNQQIKQYREIAEDSRSAYLDLQAENKKLEEANERYDKMWRSEQQSAAKAWLENKKLKEVLYRECPDKYPDNCQVCKGTNCGVRGNENIVDGVVMCDYCHAKILSKALKPEN